MSDTQRDSIKTALVEGYQARREGRLSDAKQIFAAAVEEVSKYADASLLAGSLTGLGQIERDLKEIAPALEHYREAVDLYRGLGEPLKLALTVRHVGDILRSEGRLSEARPCYEEALAIYRRESETTPLDLANALRGFALMLEAAEEAANALPVWREARGLYEAVGVQPGVIESEARIRECEARIRSAKPASVDHQTSRISSRNE